MNESSKGTEFLLITVPKDLAGLFVEADYDQNATDMVAAQRVLRNLSCLAGKPYVLCGGVGGRYLVNLEKPWRTIREKAQLNDVRRFNSCCSRSLASDNRETPRL